MSSQDFLDHAHPYIAAVDMMVLFNSAVNPFVHALLNHRFRQNIKRVIGALIH